jgi:hypothetical protein
MYVEVLPSVRKCKKAVMCLTEKVHMLDRLHLGMTNRIVSCVFSGNE